MNAPYASSLLIVAVMALSASACVRRIPAGEKLIYRADLSNPPGEHDKDKAMIVLGAEGGNRIMASNQGGASAFRIFRKQSDTSAFMLVATVPKPFLPLRAQLFPTGLDWADPGSSSTEVIYRVVAIDDAEKELWEYKTIVSTPRPEGH